MTTQHQYFCQLEDSRALGGKVSLEKALEAFLSKASADVFEFAEPVEVIVGGSC